MGSLLPKKAAVVVGGGFFGLYLAEYLAGRGMKVALVKKESHLMTRASYANQARVHHGYHYPRSILTALRSRVSFPRFVQEFASCIKSDFEKYYLIGKPLGKVTAFQFQQFCERIGAPIQQAPEWIRKLVNPNHIETVLSAVEYAFDAEKLRKVMTERVVAAGVEVRVATNAIRVGFDDGLWLDLEDPQGSERVRADHVFNCTYSHINLLSSVSGLEIIPLKHELTELCLVKVPELLKNVGLTVMCGPFFSCMPFPSTGTHSFSHVRYTPHIEWQDVPNAEYVDGDDFSRDERKYSAWKLMKKDASRYIPLLSECHYESSIWEVKTVLPRSESDDSRPILFKPNYTIKGFHCIMGGKLDNVYDAVDAVGRELEL